MADLRELDIDVDAARLVDEMERVLEGTMKHTPGPWRVQPYNQRDASAICDLGWNLQVGSDAPMDEALGEDETKANAAFIVRACNSHEELLAALKGLVPYQATWSEPAKTPYGRAIAAANAAIAKAEGR